MHAADIDHAPRLLRSLSYTETRRAFRGGILTLEQSSSSSGSSNSSPDSSPLDCNVSSQDAEDVYLSPLSVHSAKSTKRVLSKMDKPPNTAPLNSCLLHRHLDSTLTAYNTRKDRVRKSSAVKLTPSTAKFASPVHDTLTQHLTPDLGSINDDARTPKSYPRQPNNVAASHADEGSDSDGSETEDGNDSDEASSLTRKLAETAASVREMAKQLGRARLRSNISSILIITKARDNHLIKLTREMAIWIMTEMKTSAREGSSGISVYVDAQLRTSKRFDAAGIQRDFPQLFRPVQRRFSRRSSSANMSGNARPRSPMPSSTTGHQRGFSTGKSQHATTAPATPARHDTNGGEITSPNSLMNALNAASIGTITSLSGQSSHNRQESSASDTGEEPQGQLRYWTTEMCSKSPHLIDYVISLGGDGTVLFASWLFSKQVPPIIPFALGSLGFLTNFDFSNYQNVLTNIHNEGARVNLRMRFTCTVYRAVESPEVRRTAIRKGATGEIFMQDMEHGDWDAIESGGLRQNGGEATVKDREIMCFTTRPVEQFEVINDLVVDRGPSPYVSLLELFGDEHHMTTVQADGLCVATPTGSTAYSLSAGGSLVHPDLSSLLVTPICPHTLSFRPILLPDSMELRICVPYNSRATAWASFDGREGDHIKVTASTYPFPTVCADKQSTDWFQSIARTLKWNERQRQKSFVVVEEERPDPADGPVYDIDDVHSDMSESSSPDAPAVMPHDDVKQFALDHYRSDASLASNFGDRFAHPIPHPPRLSVRHSYAARDANEVRSRANSSAVPHEGEVGFRDELREPLDKRRRPTAGKSRKTDSALPTHGRPADDGLSKRRSEGQGSSGTRAFAVFGDDSSDLSDISEN